MRRISFALLLLLVFASAATGVQVHAATECERWVSEYRTQLANSDLVKRANAARHRLRHYVHRKIAVLQKPKPHPRTRVLPARLGRPKMTREEMLRELEFACGDLPIEPLELKNTVAYEPGPAFLARPLVDDSTSGPLLAQNGPQGLLAAGDGPEQSGGWTPGVGGGGGAPGGGGGGGKNPPTGGPGGGNPSLPPNGPPPTNPPTAVAPEPGSLVLVATGALGAAAALRRRFRHVA
ncbi:PEP-CTERM sorting domain-containing protein [Edaphobacter modestus]|uniref:Putative secreted protein with PEP-CTERM sorting signal n=1 Tax=Edaphobacter modestus TaxID=388466 RepID=A0A4Q7YX92_9BACT|nr:PEP-CTERM sorting domain-containing protein [Edaphobacter modestus]RZU41705.1 putative secreted protein with PEP-CTERM sorting signal [Edaphobacter modestus]